ncbi:MAG: TRAP transporter large permease [Pseudomonadota bacterium]
MSDPHVIGLGALVVLFVLLALRMPVALAMVCVGVGGNWALSQALPYLRFEPYLAQFKTLLWSNVANYDLSVVPLFVLMGFLASQANLSRDLFQGLAALTARVRGGVAMAAIGACAGFGAVCGSSLATASTMGRVALPEMAAQGYAPRLATGTLAAGGTLGILIPPSVALVIYAIIVEASIIEMFQAALIPGLLAVAGFIAVIWLRLRLDPGLAPEPAPIPAPERRAAIARLVPVLAIFGTIILGLGAGLFTPTPAAAFGVFVIAAYGVALRLMGRGGLGLSGLGHALRETAVTAGMIYFILFGAEVLKGFFTRTGLPQALADWAGASGLDPLMVLALMLLALILLGCFMESLAMILVVVPFFWPTLIAMNGGDYATSETAAFGMGPEELKIWFGILALIVVELGLITPPVGLNVFIIAQLGRGTAHETPMAETFRGVLPFFGVEILRVGLLLALPVLTLALPRLLGG